MVFGTVVAPAPADAEPYLELARTQTGTLYRKHILTRGTLLHPKTKSKINVDDAFIAKLRTNFANKVCDIVQVPLANDANDHSEDPSRNKGEVIGIEEKDGKVYALLDAREDADKFGKTYLGASAMMHLDYTDTKTGKTVGPTLLHVAVTNRPYVTDLEPYEKVVSASHVTDDEGETVMLTPASTPDEEPEVPKTAAELMSELKDKHGIDVQAALSNASGGFTPEALVGALKDAGVLSLTQSQEPEKVTPADIVGAIAELAESNVSLTNTVAELSGDRAAAEVERLVSEGFILPAQKEAMLELRMSNTEMFEKLIPKTPMIHLSHEDGVTPPDEQPGLDVEAEIAKLSAKSGTSQYFRPGSVTAPASN